MCLKDISQFFSRDDASFELSKIVLATRVPRPRSKINFKKSNAGHAAYLAADDALAAARCAVAVRNGRPLSQPVRVARAYEKMRDDHRKQQRPTTVSIENSTFGV